MSELSAALRTWIESTIGKPVVAVQELTGGASRNSYILTLQSGTRVFLRLDTGHGPLSGTVYTLAREYAVLSQLQGRGLQVPRVLAFSAEHDAALMEFIPGHTSYQKLGSEAEETKLRRDLMQIVAQLQRIDPREITTLGELRGAPLGIVIPADLAAWRLMYDERATIRDPLVELALNWLSISVPDPDERCVVVHGDVGPGNFLIEGGEIRALIDWEMARLGHPLEDVACIIARALGAPFGEPHEHLANYARLTGAEVDHRRLDYALSLVLARWQVGILMALSRPSALQNVPMLFAFRQINGMALVEALCRLSDVPLRESAFRFRAADPCPSVFAYAQDCLAQMAGDPQAVAANSYKLRGIADLMTYLKSYIDYGPERYDREDLERVAAITGHGASDTREASAAICLHARTVARADTRPLLRYLLWRLQREQAIMRESLRDRSENRIRYA